MREIKFRVWDNHYKYMNYKVLVGIYGEWDKVKDDENYTACSMWIEPENVDYKCESHWSHFEPYHKDIHLMQYTELKDKNGKEIYEGDILAYIYYKYSNDEDGHKGFYRRLFEIYYDETDMRFNYRFIKSEEIKMPKDYKDNYREVIGNIYDNPDLLEKGKEE